jgi:hypothetical protein
LSSGATALTDKRRGETCTFVEFALGDSAAVLGRGDISASTIVVAGLEVGGGGLQRGGAAAIASREGADVVVAVGEGRTGNTGGTLGVSSDGGGATGDDPLFRGSGRGGVPSRLLDDVPISVALRSNARGRGAGGESPNGRPGDLGPEDGAGSALRLLVNCSRTGDLRCNGGWLVAFAGCRGNTKGEGVVLDNASPSGRTRG